MSFSDWYLRRGRIDQRTWWLHYTLPLMGLCSLAALADSYLGFPPPSNEGWSVYTYLGGPIGIFLMVVTLIPCVSSTVARLHDRGKSAWWLLWSLLPVVGWLVLFIDNGFRAGHAGRNVYGDPPVRMAPVYA